MKNVVKSVIEVSEYVFERGLVSGKAGNVSVRFKNDGKDVVAITPTLKSLADLKEEDIVLIDENGNNLTKGKASSEYNMHLAIYREKP
ncbi:MAG: class II aldolase/adducin family protein, partial [archaeon]|nr:class II aldolase/adducin family protein [archaeon]